MLIVKADFSVAEGDRSGHNIEMKHYRPGERCDRVRTKLLSKTADLLTRYVPTYSQIVLQLGFKFQPIWSSSHNRGVDPVNEAVGGDIFKEEKPLSVWHLLPIEATVLGKFLSSKNLYAESIGGIWFNDKEVVPTTSPLDEGA